MFLTKNGPEFKSKLLAGISRQLSVKAIKTTDYYLQPNGKVQRSIRTIFSRLHHNVAEQQRNWDAFVTPPTKASSARVHRAENLPLLGLFRTRKPRRLATRCLSTTASKLDADLALCKDLQLLRSATLLQHLGNTNVRWAQGTYKANPHRCIRFEPAFSPVHSVFIERLPLTTSAAEHLAVEGYANLLLRRLGRYHKVLMGPTYVKLWQ